MENITLTLKLSKNHHNNRYNQLLTPKLGCGHTHKYRHIQTNKQTNKRAHTHSHTPTHPQTYTHTQNRLINYFTRLSKQTCADVEPEESVFVHPDISQTSVVALQYFRHPARPFIGGAFAEHVANV